MRDAAILALFLAFLGTTEALARPPDWKAGVARAVITPQEPVWLVGYGSRDRPFQAVLQELYAKAVALEDAGGTRAVLVTADLLGLPRSVAEAVAARAAEDHGLARERLFLNYSHTHTGPVVDGMLAIASPMSDTEWEKVRRYTRVLEDQLVQVIGRALQDLRPARLSFGLTRATFAVNRRVETRTGYTIGVNRLGPVDHDVPFLAVDGERGELRAIVFGYACHNTTLTGDHYFVHGDYAGPAQAELEARHPGALAFFVAGCGADANPFPRGTLEWAVRHGTSLATAVSESLTGPLKPVSGPLRAVFERVAVSFSAPPGRQELVDRLRGTDRFRRSHAELMLKILDEQGELPREYPYPIQVWRFGTDLILIGLAGEVVVDYALHLKRELSSETVWVTGYTSEVFAYIPSARILREGGYEADYSMIYYGWPGPFAPTIEETIINKVVELVRRLP